jgi:hypothetical protein
MRFGGRYVFLIVAHFGTRFGTRECTLGPLTLIRVWGVVGVYVCGLRRTMAHLLLEHPQRRAGPSHVRAVGVPQIVDPNAGPKPGSQR